MADRHSKYRSTHRQKYQSSVLHPLRSCFLCLKVEKWSAESPAVSAGNPFRMYRFRSIFLGILSYRNWKTDKAAYKEYLEAEAAANVTEEAAEDDWADEDWDVDPDEIAAEDAQEESL